MEQPRPKSRRGCLFYGCLTSTVLLLMLLAGGLAGLRYARKMYYEFTDSKPLTMPSVGLSRPELDQLQQRIDQFGEAIRQGKTAEPLTLNSDQINALIATDPDLTDLRGTLYVTIENNQLKGLISVPMEKVGLPAFRGRYLNANGVFEVSLRDSSLRLFPVSLTSATGRPVPNVYLDRITRHNLLEDLNAKPRIHDALDHLFDIQVKGNQLLVIPKKGP